MTAWQDVERAEPEFAQRVRASFDAHKHKTMATLRPDAVGRAAHGRTRVTRPRPVPTARVELAPPKGPEPESGASTCSARRACPPRESNPHVPKDTRPSTGSVYLFQQVGRNAKGRSVVSHWTGPVVGCARTYAGGSSR